MRDRETIDSELRRLAALRRSTPESGGVPSSLLIDELLDERLGHLPERAVTRVAADVRPQRHAKSVAPHRLKRLRRPFGLPLVLPLSLVAGAAALAAMFAIRDPHPAAQQVEVPPSSERPSPPAPKPPALPANHTPPLHLVDRAFVDTLKQEGVPVPSQEYVTAQGHAVCEFLAGQPDFAEAVRFLQRSSVWDASESTNVAAGAIVSYCPQYESASYQPAIPDQLQQAFQKAQSDLQAINGDLQNVRDALPNRQP